MLNRHFGLSENMYAEALNQFVGYNANPTFNNVYCETPVINRYEDLQISPMSGKPGASAPDFVKKIDDGLGSLGVSLWSFPHNKVTELHFLCQLPHGWKEGSVVYPHIHCGTPTYTAGKFVNWQLEYTVMNANEVCGASTLVNVSQPCPPARAHTIVAFGGVNMTGKTISCIIPLCLRRVPGANEYADGATLLGIDFHIVYNTIGSDKEYIK